MSEPFFYGCWPVCVGVERTIEVECFKNADSLLLECTQLGGKASRQTRIVKQWCDFFSSTENKVRKLFVSSRLPTRLFDSICESSAIEQYGFKWGPIKDLSRLENLSRLTHLGLGSCSATDLSPVSALESCQKLAVENADRVSDYSPLGDLANLQYLHIDGTPLSSNKRPKIEDVNFVSRLKRLRGLSLGFVDIVDANWPNVIAQLSHLEELFIPSNSAESDRQMLQQALPQLKSHNLSVSAT